MPKAKPQKKTPRKTKNNKQTFKSKRSVLLKIIAFALVVFISYLFYLNQQIIQHIEDGQWASPSRVYARPLVLMAGIKLSQSDFLKELSLLSYRKNSLKSPGSYRVNKNTVTVYQRSFNYPEGYQEARIVTLEFQQGFITDLYDEQNFIIPNIILEPVLLSSFYSEDGEDRIILDNDDIPQTLIEGLIAVEDRQFNQHFGINISAIIRALWVNVNAGKTVQGGSTITQQLVKNVFLSSDRSLIRKINEAFYAIIIEFHLDKQAIITAYINQVFLSQKKQVAIHGFGLASQYLFRQPLNTLSIDKQALLIAMIKGPSYYHPVKHPKRALKRRNLVLDIMSKQGVINTQILKSLKSKPLGLQVENATLKRFPSFIDLVKKQLPSQYDNDVLKNAGLRIFTTLDPIVQSKAEYSIKQNTILKQQKSLQSATVIVDYATGNVLALVGDRDPNYPGFNRAILAQRPIGSLIKPLVLYTLLEQGESLATKVKDRPITIKQSDGELWSPNNYDSKLHGEVSLYQALVKSYNLPFVRIGLEKALNPLVVLLEQFQLQKNKVIYPSLLLGSIDLTPLEVAQIYQTLANDGIYSPLSSIRFVTDKNNNLLSKNKIESFHLLNNDSTAQVQSAMNGVVEQGTAKHLKQRFDNIKLAGKTGTTDNYNDSWFVGYSERLLGVVWMGYDKNKTTHLTGSTGALKLWADIFEKLPIKSLKHAEADNIEWISTDPSGLYIMDSSCEASQLLPFKQGEQPSEEVYCDDSVLKRTTNWLRDLFN